MIHLTDYELTRIRIALEFAKETSVTARIIEKIGAHLADERSKQNKSLEQFRDSKKQTITDSYEQ